MSVEIRITNERFKRFTNNGGITKEQLEKLGMHWPPQSGWKNRLINKKIPLKLFEELVSLRDDYSSNRNTIRSGKKQKKKRKKNVKKPAKQPLIPFVECSAKLTYKQQLSHPNWQRMRLYVMNRDNFTCKLCKDNQSQLHVHHRTYFKGKYAWDIDPKFLMTVCKKCHEKIHS